MFITAVHKLAENCRYGVIQKEIIRDRLVAGIRDHGLSEKAKLNPRFKLQVYLKKLDYHKKGQYFLSLISESETHILYRFITHFLFLEMLMIMAYR